MTNQELYCSEINPDSDRKITKRETYNLAKIMNVLNTKFTSTDYLQV